MERKIQRTKNFDGLGAEKRINSIFLCENSSCVDQTVRNPTKTTPEATTRGSSYPVLS